MHATNDHPPARRAVGLLIGALVVGALGAGCGGDTRQAGDSVDGVISAGLAELPMAALDEIDPGEGYDLAIGDLAALSDAQGLVEPDPDEIDDVVRWFADVSGFGSDGAGTSVVLATSLPVYPNLDVRAIEGWESEFGFSPAAIETFASFFAPPVQFTVFGGDLGSLPDGLPEVAPGIATVGEGDDYSTNPGAGSGVRRLGRPARLAADDGRIIVSLSTPVASAWGEGETLADVDALGAVATAFDGVGALSAYISAEGDFSIDATLSDLSSDALEQVAAELGDVAAFDVVGVGSAVIDDAASVVAVYHFADGAAAESSLAGLEQRWTDAPSLRFGSSIDEVVTFRSITQDGPVVTVIAEPNDGRSTEVGLSMRYAGDVVFVHD